MIVVSISTVFGDIVAELHVRQAPLTVKNFLRYVDAECFNGGAFHRTVTLVNQPDTPIQIEVIQARVAPDAPPDRPPIALERTSITHLSHKAGTLSMARGEPDTATSDFFISVSDQPELDFGGRRHADGQGFAAFGSVLRGLDVIRRIQQAPANGQVLTPPVRIRSLRRL